MNFTKIGAIMLISLGLVGGIAATVAMQTHAQDNTAATTDNTISPAQVADVTAATTDTTTTTDSTATEPKTRGHAPLGGDGNITAINGTTITMQEEADEGGASYTVDTSQATITNNGATAALSALKVGDKIFVQGTTSGTNVTATSISLGFGGCRGQKVNGTVPPTVQ